MLAATLLTLIASSAAPPADYRRADLTDEDRHNVVVMCDATNFSRSTRADCVKQETAKLLRQKQDQVDARDAEARTAKQTAH